MVLSLRKAIALLLIVLTMGLVGCGGDQDVPVVLLEDLSSQISNPLVGDISEVSPPERIQQLKPYLDIYEPQVRIAFPGDNDTLENTTVDVDLQIRDFPIYQDDALELGPHLHLFLDDQLYQSVYQVDTPIALSDLTPGTHTLRAIAVRPWGESFKNEGAYDQVTFNVFTASPANAPDESQPLLTLNQPQGQYGAEPILLDFYLKNAPLHVIAQEDESIMDWQIRCTVNGEAFIFDRWQPIYLNGFNPGVNWVKLELIDENGDLIDNTFNTGIRTIEYIPNGDDNLSKLIRGEISLAQAKRLIDPSYVPPAPAMPEEANSQEEVKEDSEIDSAADNDELDQVPSITPPSTVPVPPLVEDSSETQKTVDSSADNQGIPPSEGGEPADVSEAIETIPSEPLPLSDAETPDVEEVLPSIDDEDETSTADLLPSLSVDQEEDTETIDVGTDVNGTGLENSSVEDEVVNDGLTSEDLSADSEQSGSDSSQEAPESQKIPLRQAGEASTGITDEGDELESTTSGEANEAMDESENSVQSDDKTSSFDADVLNTPMELLEDEADLV